jgi:hypothetical protein
MNRLTQLAARALEPGEREIILGDLAECGSSGSRAFFEVLGLVARRQLLIWTNWRPWVALIGIAGISGFYLSRMFGRLGIGIFEQVSAWRRYGVHYNLGVTSFRDDVIQMSCLAAAIFCCTAVNVSALKRLSGRATWLTGLLFYVVVLDSPAAWALLSGLVLHRGNLPWRTNVEWILPLHPASACLAILLFAIPAIRGARGRLPAIIPVTILCTAVAALLGASHAHDLEKFSNGQFRPASWPLIVAPYLLVSWPVLLLAHLRPAGPPVNADPATPRGKF